MVVLSQV